MQIATYAALRGAAGLDPLMQKPGGDHREVGERPSRQAILNPSGTRSGNAARTRTLATRYLRVGRIEVNFTRAVMSLRAKKLSNQHRAIAGAGQAFTRSMNFAKSASCWGHKVGASHLLEDKGYWQE